MGLPWSWQFWRELSLGYDNTSKKKKKIIVLLHSEETEILAVPHQTEAVGCRTTISSGRGPPPTASVDNKSRNLVILKEPPNLNPPGYSLVTPLYSVYSWIIPCGSVHISLHSHSLISDVTGFSFLFSSARCLFWQPQLAASSPRVVVLIRYNTLISFTRPANLVRFY